MLLQYGNNLLLRPYQSEPTGGSLVKWKQSLSCFLEVGVSLPSGWMFLLGPLTQTECTRPDTLGPPWGWVPVCVSVCLWVCVCTRLRVHVFRKRGGVDCQFTDRLRHSQYTLMVSVLSRGRKRAEFLAWQASCLPLSELTAVTLWEATKKNEKLISMSHTKC